MGLGCPASAGMGWTTPAGVGAAATAIRLLGIHGDAGLGSRLQPVGVLALRGLDPAVTANHTTVASVMSIGSQQDVNHLVGLIPSGFDRRGLTRNVRKALACELFRSFRWWSGRIPNVRYSARRTACLAWARS